MNHRVAPLLPIAAGLCLATEVRYYDDALPTTMNPMFARTSVDFRTADLVFDRLVYRNEITQELQSSCSRWTSPGRSARNTRRT